MRTVAHDAVEVGFLEDKQIALRRRLHTRVARSRQEEPDLAEIVSVAQVVQRLVDASAGHLKVILYAVPGKEGFYRKLGFLRMLTAMARFADPQAAIARGHCAATISGKGGAASGHINLKASSCPYKTASTLSGVNPHSLNESRNRLHPTSPQSVKLDLQSIDSGTKYILAQTGLSHTLSF
mgnify:CR=1 FL=1